MGGNMDLKDKVKKEIIQMIPSGIQKVNDQAIALERQGTEVIHLELGRPDFDTPQYIKDAAIYAIQQGSVFYTQNVGILRLRETVAEKLKK